MSRSGQICELCSSIENLAVYTVEPGNSTNPDQNILVCSTCEEQIVSPEKTQSNHWRCLNESMWSEVPAVQVVAWRNLSWAKATGEGRDQEDVVKHIDSNGTVLENGDTVVLIKDLEVKGANFTAKRGTSVRNIRLVHDNPEQIEGKINGQGIVILTQYVKK